MLIKVLLALFLIVMCGSTSLINSSKNNFDTVKMKMFADSLDSRIVDYYINNSGKLPDMSMNNAGDLRDFFTREGISVNLARTYYSNPDLFTYTINANGTFTLTANLPDGTTYVTKNSNKVLQPENTRSKFETTINY